MSRVSQLRRKHAMGHATTTAKMKKIARGGGPRKISLKRMHPASFYTSHAKKSHRRRRRLLA